MSEVPVGRDAFRREPHSLPSGWAWTWQDDVFAIEGGGQPPASQFVDVPQPGYLRLVQIRDYYSDLHKTYVPDAPNLSRCNEDDVMVARYGASLGRICRGIKGAYNVALVKASPTSAVEKAFLYYLLQTDYFQGPVHGQGARSAQAGFNREGLRSILLPLPPKREQKAIAELLAALDDKIAANTKLVTLLDSHMALKYDAALVNGGSEVPLGDVAQFHNRRRVPLSASERDKRRGAVPYYGASGVFGTVDEAIFNEQLVLVGEDGSVVKADGTPVIQYIWGPAWVNNHAHVLTGVRFSTEVLFHAVARAQVAPLVTGAVQPKISMGNLRKLVLRVPGEASMNRLQYLIDAETSSKRAAIDENDKLAATRNALLPQLLSGKLRVKEAERALEDAGV